jgi:hypothetical protein
MTGYCKGDPKGFFGLTRVKDIFLRKNFAFKYYHFGASERKKLFY